MTQRTVNFFLGNQRTEDNERAPSEANRLLFGPTHEGWCTGALSPRLGALAYDIVSYYFGHPRSLMFITLFVT